MEKGLEPRVGKFSEIAEEGAPFIFLFNSIEEMDNALMNWLGEEIDEHYGEDEVLACLEITFPVGFFDDDPDFWESRCPLPIGPECIKFIKFE